MTDTLETDLKAIGWAARQAAESLRLTPADKRSAAIRAIAMEILAQQDAILSANEADMTQSEARGLSAAMLDRLKLDAERLASIATSLNAIADQDDPVGAVMEEWTQPSGLHFRKVAVPIGVLGMIYESRPNVTADAAALCLRSANAVILRGGSEAVNSNRALHKAIVDGLAAQDINPNAVQFVMTQDRAAVGHMLRGLNGAIDLIIPRGGKGLVQRVQDDARVPVLAHLDGLNHSYIHASADLDMALDVVTNAKMRRTGICGSTETVLIDAAIAMRFLPALAERLSPMGCELRGDARAVAISPMTAASEADFNTEHLAPVLNVAIVDDLNAALAHIARHGSGHTDAIIASDDAAAQDFMTAVDSAIVLHNASTQFADGGEFGFGAEVGIATGRLHARGPVGAQHLTTYKYQVTGDGTLRP